MLDEDVRCKVDEDINYAVYYQNLPFLTGTVWRKGCTGRPGNAGREGKLLIFT